jgi:hypothetical protein
MSLADTIRTKLDGGLLPAEFADKLWAGFGSGLRCDGCEALILARHVEYEIVAEGLKVRLHIGCYGLWDAELRSRGVKNRSDVDILKPVASTRMPLETKRKPLAKVEGRSRMRLSGLSIAWRGTPGLDDWVAYIERTTSKKFILADHASERTVKHLLSRLQTMSKEQTQNIAKG